MPKGVEHFLDGEPTHWMKLVIYPLMPKGVEHLKA